MTSKKWMVLPDGRVKRWKKSSSDMRPGCWYRTMSKTPPKWLCKEFNKRERRRARHAILRNKAEPCHYVHPSDSGCYW